MLKSHSLLSAKLLKASKKMENEREGFPEQLRFLVAEIENVLGNKFGEMLMFSVRNESEDI